MLSMLFGITQMAFGYDGVSWGDTEEDMQYRKIHNLYKANKAYEEYQEILEGSEDQIGHKVTSSNGETSLQIQEKDGAGSYAKGNYYYFGPFYIGDYTAVERNTFYNR